MDKNFNKWCNDIYSDIKTNNKKVVLIAGASASGKSYSAKKLCEYLEKQGLRACYFSADNYYKGISRIITKKAFLNNQQLQIINNQKEKIISILRKIIENSPFTDKFCENNCNLLKKELSTFGKNISDILLKELIYQFSQINFDEPFALNLQQLSNDITKLINEQDIILPTYSFATGESTLQENNKLLGDKNVYIIEGLYVLRDEILNKIDTSKVITSAINCDIKSLLSRRFNRDIKSGRTTYSPEQTIMTTLTKTMPSYVENILPYNKNANFVLNTSLTDSEIKSKDTANQVKYKLNNSQINALKMLLINKVSTENQTDYYFEDNSSNIKGFIFKIRFVDGKASKISFKNILDDSQKFEEYDISNFSELKSTPETIINAFLNVGLSIKNVIKKQRDIFYYNGKKIKLDTFNNGETYIEFDDQNNPVINILKLKNEIHNQYINFLSDTETVSLEKEYKFIVDKIPKNPQKILKITQFYFNFNNKKDFLINDLHFSLSNVASARVRIAKENNISKYYLTLKSSGNFEREEQEIEINKQTAIYLLKENILSKISKTRYVFNIDGLKFEFDDFKNGLKTVEIEVDDTSNYNQITKNLNLLGIKHKDITNDVKYKNENMAK